MGMKSWGDIDVLGESKKLLGQDRDEAWTLIQEWRELAISVVVKEYERLQQLEKSLYLEKSTFPLTA
jgi:hypothetical protein